MRKACLLFILLLLPLSQSLFSLEIWQENQLLELYSNQELQSVSLPEGDHYVISLLDLIPLYETILQVEIKSEEGTLTLKDPALIQRSNLLIEEDSLFFVSGPHIFSSPDKIILYGEPLPLDDWTVWLDPNHEVLEEELTLFSKLHHLEMEILYQDDLVQSLASNWFSGEMQPDLVLFDHRDYSLISPYLRAPDTNNAPQELLERFPLGIPLYTRNYPIHWRGSDAESLRESFIASQLVGNPALTLLKTLAEDKLLPPLPVYRMDLSLLGYPLSQGETHPVSLAFTRYYERRSRLLLLEEMDSGITALREHLPSDEDGLLFPPFGESDYYMNRLLRLLPLVRSGLLPPQEAYLLIKDLNHGF